MCHWCCHKNKRVGGCSIWLVWQQHYTSKNWRAPPPVFFPAASTLYFPPSLTLPQSIRLWIPSQWGLNKQGHLLTIHPSIHPTAGLTPPAPPDPATQRKREQELQLLVMKMILWVALLTAHCCLGLKGAAAESTGLERIEKCSTRCSQVKLQPHKP